MRNANMRKPKGKQGAQIKRRNLYLARLMRGMTQAEVGALFGKSGTHYGKFEMDKTEFSGKEALALCNLFGLTIQELYDETSVAPRLMS